MTVEIYLLVLLVFMAVAALVAVETKSLLSSVISLGAVGIGLSIAFLFLMAPDLAIVQIAVEVVLLIFLIRATIGRDVVPTAGHVRALPLVLALVFVAGLLAFGAIAFRSLPQFGTAVMTVVPGAPSMTYLELGLGETGAANTVTSVILDYRAYDTLGEATVLFAAIVGALTVLRGRSRGGKHERNDADR